MVEGVFHQPASGQVLILAIILMAVGALVMTPLLSQLATGLGRGGSEREQRFKVYVAEAAINRTMADLIRGADGVATTYTTTEPNTGNNNVYTITTSYTAPSVTVSDYTPSVTLTLPTSVQSQPTAFPNYFDPGITHPNLATVAPGRAYLMRLYNVKAGTIQVNWAYSPAGISRIAIWRGMPVVSLVPIPAGLVITAPTNNPILDTGSSPSTATYSRTVALAVNPATDNSGGVYTIVFENRHNVTLTTAAFAPSGGTSNTWVYAKAYRDYNVTATVGSVSVSAYVRQAPGFTEPPAVTGASPTFSYTWATNNVSFITNEVFAYTWNSP
jgi:hypothetical protein